MPPDLTSTESHPLFVFSISHCPEVPRSSRASNPLHCKMTETPFRPREKLLEHQKYYQSIHRHTYLKGPFDKITSVTIPLALAAASMYMIGRGIYNMSHGIGKKE